MSERIAGLAGLCGISLLGGTCAYGGLCSWRAGLRPPGLHASRPPGLLQAAQAVAVASGIHKKKHVLLWGPPRPKPLPVAHLKKKVVFDENTRFQWKTHVSDKKKVVFHKITHVFDKKKVVLDKKGSLLGGWLPLRGRAGI